jgi:hypothetical protein
MCRKIWCDEWKRKYFGFGWESEICIFAWVDLPVSLLLSLKSGRNRRRRACARDEAGRARSNRAVDRGRARARAVAPSCRAWTEPTCVKTTRTNGSLYSSSICPSQQDSLLYTQFFRTHPSSIPSSIHSIHYGTHLSLYTNISMCDLVLKDLLRQI